MLSRSIRTGAWELAEAEPALRTKAGMLVTFAEGGALADGVEAEVAIANEEI